MNTEDRIVGRYLSASGESMKTVMDAYLTRLWDSVTRELAQRGAEDIRTGGGPDEGYLDARFGGVSVRITYKSSSGPIDVARVLYRTGGRPSTPSKGQFARYGVTDPADAIVGSLTKAVMQDVDLVR